MSIVRAKLMYAVVTHFCIAVLFVCYMRSLPVYRDDNLSSIFVILLYFVAVAEVRCSVISVYVAFPWVR